MRSNAANIARGALTESHGFCIWACPICLAPSGWTTHQVWAEDEYVWPIRAIHLPYTWNIDSWGQVVCQDPPPSLASLH